MGLQWMAGQIRCAMASAVVLDVLLIIQVCVLDPNLAAAELIDGRNLCVNHSNIVLH